MKSIFSKIAGSVAVVALAAVVAPSASALTAADIQLLVSMGVIPADKAAAAMAAVGGSSSSSSTSCGSYTRDLTLGSTGADVVALQSYLEAKGYLTIPTGVSKGYFGALTQSGLAKYQAAMGVSPAAGYFGPITRAKVSGDCSTSSSSSSSTSSSDLNGGEASLESYDSLSKYSNEDITEGDSAKVFAAEFDVEDGDARIERVDVRVEAVTETAEDKPWRQIEEIALYINGKKVDDMQVDDEDAWSRESSTVTPDSSRAYEVRFTGLDTVVEEGDKAEIEIEVTASDSIDDSKLDQSWRIWIPANGIRATDGAGIDQYTGSASETKDFTIESADDGDVTVRESDDDLDPSILIVDNNNKKGPYEVFRFEIDNDDSADVLLNTLTIVASTTDDDIEDVISDVMVEIDGEEFSYDTFTVATSTNRAGAYLFDLEDNNDEILVDAGDTIEVVVKAEFLKLSGNYTDGTTVQFGIGKVNDVNYGDGSVGITAEGDSTGDASVVSGRQQGSVHTLRREGIVVEGVDKSYSARPNLDTTLDDDEGVFTFEIEITALEEDAYIPDSASTTASSVTEGFVTTITGTSFDTSGADTGTSTARIADTTSDNEVNNRHKIAAGTSETFTVVVELSPGATGAYGLDLTKIMFSSTSDGSLVAYTVPTASEFSIPTQTIQD